MTWNYRIVEHKSENKWVEKWFEIIEVYYNDQGEITMYSKEAQSPYGDTPEELMSDLHLMLDAFNLPVLTAADLPFEKRTP